MNLFPKDIVLFPLLMLCLHVSKQAVPEPTCTKDRLPRFDHTVANFAQWPASDECQTSYEIECEPGYEMTLIRTCDKKSGSCQPPTLKCTIISCPPPYAVLNTTIRYNTTTYKSVATYTCDDGLYLTSGSATKTCEADKQWTFDDPYCSFDKPTTTVDYNATTEQVMTTTTTATPVSNFTGYKPIVERPDRPKAFEADNADAIGAAVTVIFLSPVMFLFIIDFIQIGFQIKVKITKILAARAKQNVIV